MNEMIKAERNKNMFEKANTNVVFSWYGSYRCLFFLFSI